MPSHACLRPSARQSVHECTHTQTNIHACIPSSCIHKYVHAYTHGLTVVAVMMVVVVVFPEVVVVVMVGVVAVVMVWSSSWSSSWHFGCMVFFPVYIYAHNLYHRLVLVLLLRDDKLIIGLLLKDHLTLYCIHLGLLCDLDNPGPASSNIPPSTQHPAGPGRQHVNTWREHPRSRPTSTFSSTDGLRANVLTLAHM